MQRPYGILMGYPRDDYLATTRIAGHEVGLDQSDRDAQICVDHAPVEPDRYAAGGGAEKNVLLVSPGKMVLHPHGLENAVIAYQLTQLLSLVWPVQARGHQDHYGCRCNARFHEHVHENGEDQAVRNGPGDVADEDAHTDRSSRLFHKRSAADRPGKCGSHRL